MSELLGRTATAREIDFVRKAVVSGIAHNIIERIERRLREEPQKHGALSMPPNRSNSRRYQ
jgi:hypothetical protein